MTVVNLVLINGNPFDLFCYIFMYLSMDVSGISISFLLSEASCDHF